MKDDGKGWAISRLSILGNIFEVGYASELQTTWEKAKKRLPRPYFEILVVYFGIGSCILAEMLRVTFLHIWPWISSSVLYFLVLVIIFLKYCVQGRISILVWYDDMTFKNWFVCFSFHILSVTAIFAPKKAIFWTFGLKILNFPL